MDLKQAVIFAGGKGERLRPLTDTIPKPLAPIHGVPFLDYLLQSLVQAGIHRVLLLVGYQSEKIIERYGHGNDVLPDLFVEYSVGTAEDLTGTRLIRGRAQLEDVFLTLYGDNYWPIELQALKNQFHPTTPVVLTALSNQRGTGEYGHENNIAVHEGKVTQYDPSRRSTQLNAVNMGYAIVRKTALPQVCIGNPTFEAAILDPLIKRGQLAAYVTESNYFWITDLLSLKRFEQACLSLNFKPIRRNPT